jgi:S1-C subfamily serine protease
MRPSLCILALLSLSSVATCRAQAPAADTPSLADKARHMTVLVVEMAPGLPRNLGSGVWIGDSGYIITCNHVVRGITNRIAVSIPYDPFVSKSGGPNVVGGGAQDIIFVTVVATDVATDVAILKAPTRPSKTYIAPQVAGVASETPQSVEFVEGANLIKGYPKLGEAMLLAGFPLGGTAFVISNGNYTGLSFLRTTERTAVRILLSLNSNPGDSGGPVLNQAGEVVGLLEGDVQSDMKDSTGNKQQCARIVLQPNGTPARDAAGGYVREYEDCNPKSGIAFAVPAQFIVDLAKANNLDLH